MLAKVPPKRLDGKTSFKSLAKYACERDHIDPETGAVERRECSTETNCLDKDTAWREMKAVSDMNGRVKDPVYHFTVSWPAHEKPTDAQIFEAGREGMKALGMEGHQYLAAVHRDTDNVHGHFMVNRVNPETYKAVYPDRDYFKLDKTMREMELRQGWSHDKGPYAVHERNGQKVVDWAKDEPSHRQPDREKLPGKARQMEVMTGNESLTTYAQGQPKKDALEALNKGGGWHELHEALGRHGLEIRQKGQGFAIHSKTDPEQTPIKASTMAQELGGGKLTKRIGPYQEPRPEIQQEKAKREYSDQRPKADPKRDPNAREEKRDERAAERRELRERYKAFTEEWKTAKAPARAAMYEDQKQRRQALTEKHKSQRETIRTSGLSTEQKKALYSVAAFDTAAKRAELNETIKGEREAFRQERPQSFRDWTADRAQEGDRAAMRQVRGWAYQDKRTAKDMHRADAQAERGPHLGTTDNEQHDPATPRRVTDRVSWAVDRKTGAVDYKVDDREAFRDTGRRLDYTEQGRKDKDSIEAGLLLAREKFAGKALRVNGPDDFRERVLQTAIERKLDVRFADKELEQRREDGRRQQSERERPDWSKMRGVASTGQQAEQRPQQPTQAQQPERRPTAPEQAKEAAQAQPAQQAAPRMTDDEARAVLNRKAPAQPNQELVEINAINAHADGYRQQLDAQFREKHGERPDPERAGGWIARFAAKSKAEAWDKEHAQIDRQVEQRKEHLRSDAPEARQFRAQAWAQAQQQYGAQHTAWEQARERAASHFETNREGEPNMANNEMERKQQQQTQQQAQQKQAQEKQMAERAAREAQARQLAEKQKQQKEKQEKEKEQARMMNQQMDIDR
ncbi:relaxase/mobilization nuclease domain-containing protein [Serratia marcescens]|uniref:TraI/MobA(P) family conjugative relaxase n=1 Tax=Serratia marcescens TaxID=615 RepID=UPI00275A32D1|nr:TraI/MobA(P) family conjugative relaxase [Serratia marcescens]MDP8617853.1 relaxase/mobilization nuclease domain-containing protein [Serratia marcescens]MDP8657877.1 relaxase/mobilization nuclease domain-containing protein [Serratia marcescens]MDP8662870.1 relaxase/mobilization nuclease domain-containing protein [Serratia marcescens]MDP8722109.1 relaxase/mobilization nuclease domain-containing protein [Serratia marcescens]